MKKLFLSFILVGCICLSVIAQHIPEPMEPPRLVNDFIGMLNMDEQQKLEQKLRNYQDTTSSQIYIVTLSDLDHDDIADYAFKLGDKWGIGQKDKDNGILILIHPGDSNVSGDIFIATGRGFEDIIHDSIVSNIIKRDIVPDFRNGDFYTGLDKATTSLIKLANGQFSSSLHEEKSYTTLLVNIIIIALIMMLAISVIRKIRSRKK